MVAELAALAGGGTLAAPARMNLTPEGPDCRLCMCQPGPARTKELQAPRAGPPFRGSGVPLRRLGVDGIGLGGSHGANATLVDPRVKLLRIEAKNPWR